VSANLFVFGFLRLSLFEDALAARFALLDVRGEGGGS
jgi:hypothetical protein